MQRKTAEILERVGLIDKANLPAALLPYADQRALEIAITIAGGAEVILLDEPTAGMSHSETARAVALIEQATAGKTLLIVEHDMGVVFGLADRISVLVYGEIIATGTPERDPRRPARARGLPGRRRRAGGGVMRRGGADARGSRTCTPSTARATCCTGWTFEIGAGEIDRAARAATGSGRSTTVKAIMGEVARIGTVASRGRTSLGWKATRSRAWASATCPRTATSSRR